MEVSYSFRAARYRMTHGPVPVPLKHVEEQACEMLQRERLDDDCRLDGHWPGAPQSHQTPPTAIPAGTHIHIHRGEHKAGSQQ